MRFPCFSLSTRLSLVFVLTVCLIGLSLATPAVGVAGDDHARAITVDSHNNIIVTGYSYNSDSTESADFLTIKYETEGNFWGRRYNSPVDNQDTAEDVTLDSDDNVIVTGYSFFGGSADCVTIKYDSTGNWLWGRRYDGPANRGEMVRGVVVDASGNVVITCSSANADYNFDIVTIKYDANGNWVWGRRYNGPANDYDWASGLTVDASGNVYVTGSSSNGANLDYVTIKYSSSGAWIWGKRFNGPANGSDNAMDLAVDAAGNVYVTGASSNGGNDDYVTIKYNSSGNWVWGRRSMVQPMMTIIHMR